MTTAMESGKRPRVLFVSNLYPNPRQPGRGIFNRKRVGAMRPHMDIEVLAAVPWFPGSGSMKGVPRRQDDGGVTVNYVRVFYTPLVLRGLHGDFFRHSIRKTVLELHRERPIDMLHGAWVYPDGFGVMRIARELGLPYLVHALGSDINVFLQSPDRARKVRAALEGASAVIAVSEALRQRILQVGIDPEKVHVVRNGVDSTRFQRLNREDCRRSLGLDSDSKVIGFVGNLVPIKGTETLVEAAGRLVRSGRDVQLVLVGDGPCRRSLERQSCLSGLAHRVRFTGQLAHGEVATWLGACDVLSLPSHNEGIPNVILEALACGVPVVASCVGGVAEVIDSDELGLLVEPGDPVALAEALASALDRSWDRDRLVAGAARFTWEAFGTRVADIVGTVLTGKGH